uniref:Uncharacterized protein n=1 Tax=Desulfacinum infernum TaxID=35837 RepID=A0A832EJD0_9BACT
MSHSIPLKTLAKILTTMACTLPHEYGLFWDDDGTMPWKEFYWALQEDPRLRFVRESTLKALALLGHPLPFVLDGSRLRLVSMASTMAARPSMEPPDRLFTGIRLRRLAVVRLDGLRAVHRSYVPLWADKDTAERMARRRTAHPLVLEVRAREAHGAGSLFYQAGDGFFLTRSVDVAYVVFPLAALEEAPEKETPARLRRLAEPGPADDFPSHAGSFHVEPHHLHGLHANRAAEEAHAKAPSGKKRAAKGGWKKAARAERRKREV